MIMIERGSEKEKERDCVRATPVAARAHKRKTHAIIFKHIVIYYSHLVTVIGLSESQFRE